MGVYIAGSLAKEVGTNGVAPGFNLINYGTSGLDQVLNIAGADGITAQDVTAHMNRYLDSGHAPEAFIVEHGLADEISNGRNHIAYNDLFSGIDREKPTNFYIESCFGGSAMSSLEQLPKGSKLFTAATADSVSYPTADNLDDYAKDNAGVSHDELTAETLYKTRLATTDYQQWGQNNDINERAGAFARLGMSQETIAGMPRSGQELIPTKFGISGHGVEDLRAHVNETLGQDLTETAARLKADIHEPAYNARIDSVAHTMRNTQPGAALTLPVQDHGIALALTYQRLEDTGQIDRWVAQAQGVDAPQPQVAATTPAPEAPAVAGAAPTAAAVTPDAPAPTAPQATVTADAAQTTATPAPDAPVPQPHQASGAAPVVSTAATESMVAQGGLISARHNANSQASLEVKSFLASQGYDVGDTANAAIDDKATAAITQFQRDKSLTMIDGIVGPETYGAIHAVQQEQALAQAQPPQGGPVVGDEATPPVAEHTPPPVPETNALAANPDLADASRALGNSGVTNSTPPSFDTAANYTPPYTPAAPPAPGVGASVA